MPRTRNGSCSICSANRIVQAIRIDWAAPVAKQYLVQFWTGEDPIKKPAAGSWQLFPHGRVRAGQGRPARPGHSRTGRSRRNLSAF